MTFILCDSDARLLSKKCVYKLVTSYFDLLVQVFSEIKGIQLPDPFPRVTYADAMDRYGSDRPDARFDLELKDVILSASCLFR